MTTRVPLGDSRSEGRRSIGRYCGLFLFVFALANVLVAQSRSTLEAERRKNLLIAEAGPAGKGVVTDAAGRETFESYWRRIPDGRESRLVVVAGMSQMYAINEPQPSDRIIAALVDEWLTPHSCPR